MEEDALKIRSFAHIFMGPLMRWRKSVERAAGGVNGNDSEENRRCARNMQKRIFEILF